MTLCVTMDLCNEIVIIKGVLRMSDKLKNVVYVGFTIVIILLMSVLTFFYLKNKPDFKGDVPKSVVVSKSDVSKSKSDNVSSSSSDFDSDVSDESTSVVSSTSSSSSSSHTNNSISSPSSTLTETSTSVETESTDYISAYSFLYEAAGGDTLYTISELTGVSVDVIASANHLDSNVVLVKGQKVYVP